MIHNVAELVEHMNNGWTLISQEPLSMKHKTKAYIQKEGEYKPVSMRAVNSGCETRRIKESNRTFSGGCLDKIFYIVVPETVMLSAKIVGMKIGGREVNPRPTGKRTFSEADIVQIRQAHALGAKYKDLADVWGVSAALIRNIVLRNVYKDIK